MKANKVEIILDFSEIIKPVKERVKQLHLEGDKYKYYHAGMINTLDAVAVALKELDIPKFIIKNEPVGGISHESKRSTRKIYDVLSWNK